MFKARFLILGAVAAVAVASMTGPVDAKELKFANFASPKSTLARAVIMPWINRVNPMLKGTDLQIKGYMGGSLGRNPAKQLKLVRDGVADFGFITLSYAPSLFSDSTVIELPFLTRNGHDGSLAHWRLSQKIKLKGYDKVKWIALSALPPYLIHMVKPIKGLDSLKNKKIRGAGRLQTRLLKSLGATPVHGTIVRSAESLSRGTWDGMLGDWNAITVFRGYKFAKHHLMFPFTAVSLGLGMNVKVYDGLPAKARRVIDETTGEGLSEHWGKSWDRATIRMLKIVNADKGQVMVKPSAADAARMRKALKPITADWIKANPRGQQIYDTVQAILKDIRK